MTEETKTDTAEEIVKRAKDLPAPPGGFSLEPRNFDEAYRFANMMANTEMVPKNFRGKPADILLAVQLGHEVGLPAMQAMQNIAVINGRPTMWGDAIMGLIKASGLEEWTEETWDQATETARCRAKRKGDPVISDWTFSMADARKVKVIQWENNKRIESTLADKDTYQSWPRRMCQMRCRGFAFRDKYADVLKGLRPREEEEDLAFISPGEFHEPEAIDLTPKRLSQPTAAPVQSEVISSVSVQTPQAGAVPPQDDVRPVTAEEAEKFHKLIERSKPSTNQRDTWGKWLNEKHRNVEIEGQLTELGEFVKQLEALPEQPTLPSGKGGK